MSNPVFKAPRPIAEIQGEYTNMAARLGQVQYQIETLGKDKEAICGAMRDLNAEAFAVAEAEAKARKAADEAKAAEEAKKSEEPNEEVKNGQA